MAIIDRLRRIAAEEKKRVVLPEGWDDRILRAAALILNDGLAELTVMGDPDDISEKLSALGAETLPEIVFPQKDNRFQSFARAYYEKRREKGMTLEEAVETMKNPLFFGAMLVEQGYADGCVAGAASTSADVLRAALRIIGTRQGVKTVSSFMIMETEAEAAGEDGTLFFADCAVIAEPKAAELADIAISASDSWQKFMGTSPRTALLSFSTKGSADGAAVEKVREAIKIAREKRPDITIDGELQADAALVARVAERKAPGSPVAGRANVLIFPDLASGNIGYKLVERFSKGSSATGPILQGLKKPMNDLSRGCDHIDVINTVLVTVYQSLER